MQAKKLLPIIACVATMAGCASSPNYTGPSHWEGAQRTEQLDRHTSAMLESISESLTILAEVKSGSVFLDSTPEEMQKREWLFRTTPPGMGIPISVTNYIGHPQSLVEMVATMTGYKVENVGSPSFTVRNVSINALSRPAVEVLRSVASQMGCDGMVDVQSGNRKIIVDWKIRVKGEGECEG